jgi:hypothetical protein
MSKGRVVSLCDWSHVALYPWRDAGYECTAVDIKPARDPHDGVQHVVGDVRAYVPPRGVVFVLAWPPCTDLARSGARWWEAKGEGALMVALGMVTACVAVAEHAGAPWILENPVGRLSTHWRKPDGIVHPWEFANWADNPEGDAYTKKTCLWVGNGARLPERAAWCGPVDTKRIHHSPDSKPRAERRSMTPEGLARGIYMANRLPAP